MQRVQIVFLDQENSQDKRGPTWQLFQRRPRQITVCNRIKGSISSHFHKGDDVSKCPERIFIIRGKVKMLFSDLETGESCEETFNVGKYCISIVICPWVAHRTEVLEDAIIFESRETVFDKEHGDTYQIEIS